MYSGLARAAVRYRWPILGIWLVILVIAALGAARAEHALKTGGFSLPGTEFHTASDVLSRDLDISSDKAAIVVFHSDRLLVTDRPFYDSVQRAIANLTGHPLVTKAESFYDVGIPDMVSPDNHTTYALVTLQGSEEELEQATPDLRALVGSDDIEVHLVGIAAANHDVQEASAEDLVRVERFTFPIVFVLLVIVFGSVVAAGTPIVLGAVCVALSLAVIYVVAQVTDLSIFALNTASMIGLGLAIDFSLIMVSRFREELAHLPLDQALDRTLQTAGRSITFSGVTLALTMAVLTLFPVMVIRSIALSIVIVAAVAVTCGLLLLPALLAALGGRIDSLNVRRFIPGLRGGGEGGRWRRWAYTVMRRPWLSLGLALLVLGLMALPVLRLERRSILMVTTSEPSEVSIPLPWLQLDRRGVTVQVLPSDTESRVGYELVQRQFGAGEPAPIFVVVQAPGEGRLWQPAVLEGILQLHQRLEADPRVAHVQSIASVIPNPTAEFMRSLSPATISSNPDRQRIIERIANLDGANTTTVLLVYPRTEEASEEAKQLMLDLRRDATTWAPGLQATRVLVGGNTAQHYDFDKVVYDGFPLLLGLSLTVTFVILMIFFHSVVLPVKAIALNIVSILASYGILVLIFQQGYGDSLLGFTALGALLSYTPVLLFSILFGLSTDYEVFLLTRVREYFRQGYSNEDSVALGLEHTAGIITAAGLIMIAVFGSFALTNVLVIKELGFGLAVAVLLDTTLVRMVLVPATMKLMGNLNWWMPRSLGRLVPEIDEGEPPAAAPLCGGVDQLRPVAVHDQKGGSPL